MQPVNWSLIVAGGGTGGHLSPALAVIDALQKTDRPPQELVFLASGREVEQQFLPDSTTTITMGELGAGSFRKQPLTTIRKFWNGYRQSQRLLRQHHAAVLLGMGGSASLPGLLAAVRGRIPIVLIESNAVDGRVVSWFQPFARQVCRAFDSAQPHTQRSRSTGVPVLPEIAQLFQFHQPESSARRELLILGGSQGSRSLNNALIRLVESRERSILRDHLPTGWTIRHQTGTADHERVAAAYRDAGIGAETAPFFQNMAAQYRNAALVITRAGGVTLAELACARLPALIVPYPNSVRDHQLANARRLQAAGAAVLVEEERSPETFQARFETALEQLLRDSAWRDQLSRSIAEFARPLAARDVAVEILSSLPA